MITLTKLKIRKISISIGHSSSIYNIVCIWHNEINFKCLCSQQIHCCQVSLEQLDPCVSIAETTYICNPFIFFECPLPHCSHSLPTNALQFITIQVVKTFYFCINLALNDLERHTHTHTIISKNSVQ